MILKKPDIQVKMNGKEYMDYLNHKKKNKLSSDTILRILIVVMCVSAITLGVYGIVEAINYEPIVEKGPTIFDRWYDFADRNDEVDWTTISKFSVLLLLPVVAISWLFHGVQVRLLA